VQTGDPAGKEIGYIDPSTKKLRTIPLEVKVASDKAPLYEETMEELGRSNEIPALPFNAYGTLAMARAEFENNSASSQVFWLLKESELTPSGSNLLDGRYAVFGYVTENVDALGELKVGDVIESLKVVQGMELLENFKPSVSVPPLAEEPMAQ
jgi:cyclophilin family peptidyl-prolyl cis-trans isomerase